MQVFLKTNPFRTEDPQYAASAMYSFWVPTSDSREMIQAARQCMAHVYVQTEQQHAGIIVTPQNNPYEVAKRVGILLNTLTADEITNQLLYA